MTTTNLDDKSVCPNCGSGDLVEGSIVGRLDLGGGLGFRPKGRGFAGWLLRRDIAVPNPTFACAQCGLMWSFINVKPLRRMMAQPTTT